MPQDLPGFYFDPEKNRYFPVKGRIPGSNPNTTASHIQGSSSSKPNRTNDKSNTQRRKRIKAADLFQLRELSGKLITFSKRKSSFQHEYQNIQASQPTEGSAKEHVPGAVIFQQLEVGSGLGLEVSERKLHC
ncbi:uncharacterized protein LOC143883320 isoform X2 [Tasmannia lanceolata]|uniref:uncharacterized protein LOC143883317 isoform X2 n=1 Tax=Tasmannia lanceolata TaxID=3420 RepID=UPI004064565A